MKKSIDELAGDFDTLIRDKPPHITRKRAIAMTLEQLLKPGHILTREGDDVTVRKVLGTLPVTKDGVVVMNQNEVFHPNQDPSFHLIVMDTIPDMEPSADFPLPDDCEYMGHYSYYERDTGFSQWESYDIRECYSTREAALAANPPTTGQREDV